MRSVCPIARGEVGMLDVIVGLTGVGLIAYLFVSIFRPEKF